MSHGNQLEFPLIEHWGSTAKSSIFIGICIISHPALGMPKLMDTPISTQVDNPNNPIENTWMFYPIVVSYRIDYPIENTRD